MSTYTWNSCCICHDFIYLGSGKCWLVWVFLIFKLLFVLFICICVCMYYSHMPHMWNSENYRCKPVLSLYHVDSRDWIWVVQLGNRYPYPLSLSLVLWLFVLCLRPRVGLATLKVLKATGGSRCHPRQTDLDFKTFATSTDKQSVEPDVVVKTGGLGI